MLNPYLTAKIAELTASHKQAMDAMFGASRAGGEQAMRAIQLWQQYVALVMQYDENAAATLEVSGGIVMQEAAANWPAAKAAEVAAIDAFAASQGLTRQDILDQYAAMPPTQFS